MTEKKSIWTRARHLPSAAIMAGVGTVVLVGVVTTVAFTDAPSRSLSNPYLEETENGLQQRRTGAGTQTDGVISVSEGGVPQGVLTEDGESRLNVGSENDLTAIEDPDAPHPEKSVERNLDPSEVVEVPGEGQIDDQTGLVVVPEDGSAENSGG